MTCEPQRGMLTLRMDIVQSFYTDRPVPPKTGLVLEEIFEKLNVDAAPPVGRAGFPDALAAFKKNRSDFSGNNQINSESRKEPK